MESNPCLTVRRYIANLDARVLTAADRATEGDARISSLREAVSTLRTKLLEQREQNSIARFEADTLRRVTTIDFADDPVYGPQHDRTKRPTSWIAMSKEEVDVKSQTSQLERWQQVRNDLLLADELILASQRRSKIHRESSAREAARRNTAADKLNDGGNAAIETRSASLKSRFDVSTKCTVSLKETVMARCLKLQEKKRYLKSISLI